MEIEYIESFGLGILSWIIQRLLFLIDRLLRQPETLSFLISATLMFVTPIVLFALAPNTLSGIYHGGLYILGVSVAEVLDQTFFGFREGGR